MFTSNQDHAPHASGAACCCRVFYQNQAAGVNPAPAWNIPFGKRCLGESATRDHETLPACLAAFRRFERASRRVGLKVAWVLLFSILPLLRYPTFATRRRSLSAFGPRQSAATRTLACARHENPWPPFDASIAIQERNGLDSGNGEKVEKWKSGEVEKWKSGRAEEWKSGEPQDRSALG